MAVCISIDTVVDLYSAVCAVSLLDQTMKKTHLPEKICPVCLRSFTWRKKWEKAWPEVKYCSKRCAGQRSLLGVKHD